MGLAQYLMMDKDVLDIEVPCYICKELVILGNDYRCHLNFAHDIFDTNNVDKYVNLAQQRLDSSEEITLDEESKENIFSKSCTFQCEICGDALKGKDVIEAHVDSLHMDIVEELEEEVSDFYVLLPEVSLSGDLLTAEQIAKIFSADEQFRQLKSKDTPKRKRGPRTSRSKV